MNTCEYCELVIGRNYKLFGNSFASCCYVYVPNDGEIAKYVEYDGAFHYFRQLHSMRCPSCRMVLNTIAMPCAHYKDGLFNREDVYEPVYNEYEEDY